MFIKQHRVRHSRFTSRFARSSLKRREYIASLYTATVLQGVLFLFLVLGAYRAFQMITEKFPYAAWYLSYAVPAFMLAIAVVVFVAFTRGIRRGIQAYKNPSLYD